MYVIEVIPLIRGSQVESLTYYSSRTYGTGTIVKIPVRKKEVSGLIIDEQPVSATKTAVRAATFSLRKLPIQEEIYSLPPLLLETARQLCTTTSATLGSILFALLPEEIKEGTQTLESNLPCLGTYETPAISVMTATTEERLRNYRSRVRAAFARRGSVLLLVPSSGYLERAVETLAPGIADRVIVLSSSLPKKRIERAYKELHDMRHAKLIVATPSHAFVDRHDITDIIIEHSRSPHYKSRVRPYLDYRDVMITLAKFGGRQVLLGDLLPRTEDEWLRQEDVYITEGEQPKRMIFNGTARIIEQTEEPEVNLPFRLISPKIKRAIYNTLRPGKRVFIYAARRGLAPVVVCGDCGYIFRCPDSGTPYSLLRTGKGEEEKRWFHSSVSGRRVRAADTCPECSSWRLRERGIGIQQIEDELHEAFPKEEIIIFDHTTATTPRKARMLIGDFYENKQAIMLGTSMALPYLEKPISLSVVPSLDAARAIPTWRADEELFSLLMNLREISNEGVIVQTRSPVDDLLKNFKTGHIEQFYKDEIELRRTLRYPPFSVFIHLTISGTAENIKPVEEAAKEILQNYQPAFYNAPLSNPEKSTRYGLIRIEKKDWPNKELVNLLRSLPPAIRIEINPPRIV